MNTAEWATETNLLCGLQGLGKILNRAVELDRQSRAEFDKACTLSSPTATGAILQAFWNYDGLRFSFQRSAWHQLKAFSISPCLLGYPTPEIVADHAAFELSKANDITPRSRPPLPLRRDDDLEAGQLREKLICLAMIADQIPTSLVPYFRLNGVEASAFSFGAIPKPKYGRGNPIDLESKLELLVMIRKARQFNDRRKGGANAESKVSGEIRGKGVDALFEKRITATDNHRDFGAQFPIIYEEEYARVREEIRSRSSYLAGERLRRTSEKEEKKKSSPVSLLTAKKRKTPDAPSLDRVLKDSDLSASELARFIDTDPKKLSILLDHLRDYEWACFINDERHERERGKILQERLIRAANELCLEFACLYCAEKKAISSDRTERKEWEEWFAQNVARYCRPSKDEFKQAAAWMRGFAQRCFETLSEDFKTRAETFIDISGELTNARLIPASTKKVSISPPSPPPAAEMAAASTRHSRKRSLPRNGASKSSATTS